MLPRPPAPACTPGGPPGAQPSCRRDSWRAPRLRSSRLPMGCFFSRHLVFLRFNFKDETPTTNFDTFPAAILTVFQVRPRLWARLRPAQLARCREGSFPWLFRASARPRRSASQITPRRADTSSRRHHGQVLMSCGGILGEPSCPAASRLLATADLSAPDLEPELSLVLGSRTARHQLLPRFSPCLGDARPTAGDGNLPFEGSPA